MRISTYEIILPMSDENFLLVNSIYGAFDIVKKNDAEKLKASNFEELLPATKARLFRRGHITDKSKAEEFDDMKLLSRIYKMTTVKSNVEFIIMPTYDCNFRCPYCYEQHRLCKGQGWLNKTMSDELIEKIFSMMKNYRDRGYLVNSCTLYGGEPFLEKNLPVVRKIFDSANQMNLTLNAITNGYDLESYLDLITEVKFGFLQITVDGVGEINDRRRIHKDGKSTYERILKNVELALERGIEVFLRVNVGRENIHGIGALIEDLKARGFIQKEKERVQEEKFLKQSNPNAKTKRGLFYYYFKSANNDLKPENNVSEKEIFDELIANGFSLEEAFHVHGLYRIPAAIIPSLFEKKNFIRHSPAFCSAEGNSFIIDPFGAIFSCWDLVAQENSSVGFLDAQTGRFIFNFNSAKWRTRTTDIMKNCHDCPYCFICRGGCAARAKYLHGDCFREYCGEEKETFNFVATKFAEKHWQENHTEELTLSLAEPLSKLAPKEREILMTTKHQKELFEIAKETGLIGEISNGNE